MDFANALSEIERAVSSAQVLTSADLRATYEIDWSRRWKGNASAVVRPANTDELSAVLAVCNRFKIACVPQGGRTGLVGGGVPLDGEVVISVQRLGSISTSEIDSGIVTVGAGVTLGEVQATAARSGWDFGVDIASRESATIGGMIATNAGGMKVIRHGQMRAQVASLEVVLADGSVLKGGGASLKDNAGFDLSQLMIGSEGTLGIVTEARLKLVRQMPSSVVFLVGVDNLAAGVKLVGTLRRATESLESAEFIDAASMDVVCEFLSSTPPIQRSRWYVLMECAADADPLRGVNEALTRSGLDDDSDTAVAMESTSQRNLWQYREQITDAISCLGIPHKLDVGIPLARLDEFADQVVKVVQTTSPGVTVLLFGHLGEGNVHVNILGADPDDESVDDAVLQLVAQIGGNIASEHGVGRAKARWLDLSRTATEIRTMREIKQALDPHNILNPGVLFPSHVSGVR
jgi:FAD/FMN-containing dehydrogenase